MPMFILSLRWTEQAIRAVKDAPKRAQAARDLAKKVGVESRRSISLLATTTSLSLSMPLTGTTSSNLHSPSVRKEMCARGLCARGPSLNL
jgi:hypothetical protein